MSSCHRSHQLFIPEKQNKWRNPLSCDFMTNAAEQSKNGSQLLEANAKEQKDKDEEIKEFIMRIQEMCLAMSRKLQRG